MCSSPEESQVDEETEICIDNGVIHDDYGQVEYEGLRACCADYPEEGYIPLED